jgi:NAD(P)H-flavin reductase
MTSSQLSATARAVDAGSEPVDPMLPRRFTVVRSRRDTADTFTLELEPLDGEPMQFAPGQFTMLQAFGVGEVPISISGDPATPGTLQHTVRDVGSVTRAIVSATPGTVLGVRGPFGTGWDVESARGGDVVFVGGGIGLAPLRPAILEVCARREQYRRVVLLYGARTPHDILFEEDLRRWARDFGIDVEVSVENGQHGWQGRIGLVTHLIGRTAFEAEETTAFVCGPEIMMRCTATAFLERGVPSPRLRLSMERNMKCGVGLCGHCQLREFFLCVDGPVLSYDLLEPLMARAEM